MQFIDLTNKKFGRLKVIRFVGRRARAYMWSCLCSCGTKSLVRSCNLKNGHTRSCGCLSREAAAKRCAARIGNKFKTVHGHTAGGKRSPTHCSWMNMLARCTDHNQVGWKWYGGNRPPVKVCNRWMEFKNFLADMGKRPPNTSLGRHGDIGNYEPGNCSWQTQAQQRIEQCNKQLKMAA